MSTCVKTYHHGDLRAALVSSALDMLEAGETYSMRAVARHIGVSPTAPYRHFPDRDALDSAIAAEGFDALRKSLTEALEALPASAAPVDVLAELGTAYVGFALQRPALFRLMFGNQCDEQSSARVQAAQALHSVLGEVINRLFPKQAGPELVTALWSFAHGLAFLHLDGKYRPEPADEVAARVRDSVSALLGLSAR